MHGIPYVELKEGSTLTLRKYSGGYDKTVIGAAKEVVFEKGAYAVTMNNSDAYLIAYLFEPNSHRFATAEDHSISFAHIGYIKDGDGLYRSEQSGVYKLIAEMDKNPVVEAPVTEPVTEAPKTGDVPTSAPNTEVMGTGNGVTDIPVDDNAGGSATVIIAVVVIIVAVGAVALIFVLKKRK